MAADQSEEQKKGKGGIRDLGAQDKGEELGAQSKKVRPIIGKEKVTAKVGEDNGESPELKRARSPQKTGGRDGEGGKCRKSEESEQHDKKGAGAQNDIRGLSEKTEGPVALGQDQLEPPELGSASEQKEHTGPEATHQLEYDIEFDNHDEMVPGEKEAQQDSELAGAEAHQGLSEEKVLSEAWHLDFLEMKVTGKEMGQRALFPKASRRPSDVSAKTRMPTMPLTLAPKAISKSGYFGFGGRKTKRKRTFYSRP